MGNARVVVVLVMCVLTVGCSENEQPALSERQFRVQANAICEELVRAVADVRDPGTGDLDANARYLDRIIPPMETAVEKLERLRPDESFDGESEELVSRYRELVDAEVDLRDAARRGDHEAFTTAFGEVVRLAYATTDGASALGWTACE